MAKKEQKQLILWAVVALVLGVLIGVLMTNAVTAGKARSVLSAEEDSKQAANITEQRIDLTLDTLNVNTIRNRVNPLIITSTNDVDFNVSDSIQMYAGISAINMYANSQDGPWLNIKSHRVALIGNHIALADTQGTTAISIDNEGAVKFPNIPVVNNENPGNIYTIGETIEIENHIIEIMNIWDANGAVQLQLSTDANVTIATEIYTVGDVIFDNYLSANLVVSQFLPNAVVIIVPQTSNLYYACLEADGTLV